MRHLKNRIQTTNYRDQKNPKSKADQTAKWRARDVQGRPRLTPISFSANTDNFPSEFATVPIYSITNKLLVNFFYVYVYRLEAMISICFF